ncbi:MAG: iron chelate uptake ABC transporter family permease subunit, partial [Vicinamibacterales bacterium]
MTRGLHPNASGSTSFAFGRDSRVDRRPRPLALLGGLVALLAAVFLLSLVVGSTWIPVRGVMAALTGHSIEHDAAFIVVDSIRLPRSLTAMLAGASLGIAGLQMQTLFR